MTVIVGQQHGATAKPSKGQIEVFLQRKTKNWDSGGVNENLDKPSDLHFRFKTKFDVGTPLSTLYDEVLVQLVTAHQSELLISITNESFLAVDSI